MDKIKVHIVDYEDFKYQQNEKWKWKFKKKLPIILDDSKPPIPDPIYPDFNLDDDVIVIDDEIVSDETTTVFSHRGKFSNLSIETKKSFILKLSGTGIHGISIENQTSKFNIEINKRDLYAKELESTAAFEVITLKSKEIINLAVE